MNNERVFAYVKATELNDDELENVSGGKWHFPKVSHDQGIKVTPAGVVYDVVWDW